VPAASALAEYAIAICRRCAKAVGGEEADDFREVGQRCSDAADVAATLLLAT
jgi:hypothetical protein